MKARIMKRGSQGAGHRAEERCASRIPFCYNNVITESQALFLTTRYMEGDCKTARPQD